MIGSPLNLRHNPHVVTSLMPLTSGTRLGHYDVTSLLGEGGMGQVWQATDTQLNRQVALKILPDAFAADPDRLARFQREAQILASLNHPGIAAIYGIEEAEPSTGSGQGAVRALVLELVEGPTLADRIAKGPIPVDEALPIAKQIAEALEAAHEQGVIHRDLKPANVKVKADGTVKVLDFGLAKALDTTPEGDPSQSPTLTAAATQMGVIMGTAAYMAPEQAKGRVVDKRADVWAFGAVFFEMLTAAKPFTGKDVSDTLAAVLRIEPDLDALPASTPPRLRQVLQACLQKEPKDRVRDIGDVMLAVDGVFESTLSPPSDTASWSAGVGWKRQLPAGLGVFVLGAVAAGFWAEIGDTPPLRPLQRFELNAPSSAPVRPPATRNQPALAISRDGSRVVYRTTEEAPNAPGAGVLYLREVGQLEATLIRGTEGAHGPFFSPDGAWVGFNDARDSTLKKVSILGGPPVTICSLDDFLRGASWRTNGTIVFATHGSGGLLQVSAGGGEPERLTTVDPDRETSHWWPELLPGDHIVLFTAWSGTSEGSRIAALSLDTGEVTDVMPGGSYPRFSVSGHLVYAVGSTLRAVGFDPATRAIIGSPVPVVEDVTTGPLGAANYSLAEDGSIVYLLDAGGGMAAQRSLVWVDREGREAPLDTPSRPYIIPSVSPDGTMVAVDVADPEGTDIWLHDLERGTEARLTTDPANDSAPLWTPDGDAVVFMSDREDGVALFQKLADASGDAARLASASDGYTMMQPSSWGPDGRTLLYWEAGVAGQLNVGLVSMDGDRSAEALLDTEFREGAPAVSPDGRWMAYHSNETGQDQVYVQRFPMLGGKRTISTGFGHHPLWSPDGSELFYRTASGMRVVPVLDAGDTFRAGVPEVLFETPYFLFRSRRTYDLHPDGQRFLMVKDAGLTDESGTTVPPRIVLIQNWSGELSRLAPTAN